MIRYNALFVGLLAIGILVMTNWYLKNTKNGIALRAVASDINTAYLMGIPGRKIFAVTVAISSALTTTAGVLLGSFYFLRPDSGQNPMLTAIVVVVFGFVVFVASIGIFLSVQLTHCLRSQLLDYYPGVPVVHFPLCERSSPTRAAPC